MERSENAPVQRGGGGCSLKNKPNEGISAASFCHQVAALVPDLFCNFCLEKNYKIANSSANIEAREKMSTYLESLEF